MSAAPRLALLALAPLLLASVETRAQTVQFPPGSAIGLVPPKGMRPSGQFAGFEDPSNGSSVLTVDMPEPSYGEIIKGFTAEGLAASGLQAAGPATDWAVAGGQGRLIRGRQTARGVTYRKWVLLAKSPLATAMLSVQSPDSAAAGLPDAAIEQSLKTVAFRKPPGLPEQVAALPFKVGDFAGFRPVRTISGSSLLLTEGPQDTLTGAAQPAIAIASGVVGPVDPKSQVALARQGFLTADGVSDLSTSVEAPFTLDGAGWVRMEGVGTYRDTLEAVYVVQYMRFTPVGYIRLLATCRTLDQPRFEARFKSLAQSIGPK